MNPNTNATGSAATEPVAWRKGPLVTQSTSQDSRLSDVEVPAEGETPSGIEYPSEEAATVPDIVPTWRGPVVLSGIGSLIGALLQCTAEQAAQVLTHIEDRDAATEGGAQILAVIRDLSAHGVRPEPGAVMAELERRIPRHNIARMGMYLVDCYQGIAEPTSVSFYAVAFLEGAARRAAAEYAVRVQQAAEEESVDDLAQTIADRAALDDVWRRLRTLVAGDQQPRAIAAYQSERGAAA